MFLPRLIRSQSKNCRTFLKTNPFNKNFSSYRSTGSNIRYARPNNVGLFLGITVVGSVTLISGFNITGTQSVKLDSGRTDVTISSKTVNVADENGDLFVKPPTDSPPFPKSLSLPNGLNYELFGIGVRTVSFLSFHVYAVGIYIASEDKSLAHNILKSAEANANPGDLKSSLLDPTIGTNIISHLLDHGVRLDLRIVPVRNTDFGHLRDGFVRGVIGHPYYKKLTEGSATSGSDPEHAKLLETLGQGVNELKVSFSRKMSVPKHNILHLHRESDGSMPIIYYKGVTENSPEIETISLGTVHSPNVSKIMFLHYLSGKNPASGTARESAVEGLINI